MWPALPGRTLAPGITRQRGRCLPNTVILVCQVQIELRLQLVMGPAIIESNFLLTVQQQSTIGTLLQELPAIQAHYLRS